MVGYKQEKILRLIIDQHLTQAEICRRLKMTKPRVSLIVKQLKNKSLISYGRFPQETKGGGGHPGRVFASLSKQQNKHLIRLHGQVFSLKILNGSQVYDSTMKLNRVLEFESHKIQLFPKKLIVHSWPGLEFLGISSQEAHDRSLPYWKALFDRLEKRLNILIFKPGSTYIKEIKAGHYAEENNGLAQDLRNRRQALHLKGGDGLGWLITDMSKGMPELETIHPLFSKADMAAIKPLFDDLRLNCPGMSFSLFKAGLVEALRPQPAPDSEKLKGKDTYFG
jgi:hypothetical protein